jgi:hypothetical protein
MTTEKPRQRQGQDGGNPLFDEVKVMATGGWRFLKVLACGLSEMAVSCGGLDVIQSCRHENE